MLHGQVVDEAAAHMDHGRIPAVHRLPDQAQQILVDLDPSLQHIMDVGQLTESSVVVAVGAADSAIVVVVAPMWIVVAVVVVFVAQAHHSRQWDQLLFLVAVATNCPSLPVAFHKVFSVAPVEHRRAYVDDNYLYRNQQKYIYLTREKILINVIIFSVPSLGSRLSLL